MSLAQFIIRVRKALSLSESYDEFEIPGAINAQVKYFLRGWNFPENVLEDTFTDQAAGEKIFTLPSDLKKLEMVLLADARETPATYKVLERTFGFCLAQQNGVPRFYWQDAAGLVLDTPLPEAGLDIRFWFQSLNTALAVDWMIEKYEEALFNRVVYAFAADVQKPEVQQMFGPLWAESKRDLAVYLNELEFDNTVLNMRDANLQKDQRRYSRYPS